MPCLCEGDWTRVLVTEQQVPALAFFPFYILCSTNPVKFSTVDFTCAVPSAANWAQSLWLECITQSTNTLSISFPIDLPWLSLTCLSFSNFKCGLSAPVCQTAPFLPWLKCDHLGISAPVSALWGPSPDVVSLTLLGSSPKNPLSRSCEFSSPHLGYPTHVSSLPGSHFLCGAWAALESELMFS